MSNTHTCGTCGGEIGDEVHYNVSAESSSAETGQPFCSEDCARLAAEEEPEEVTKLKPIYARLTSEMLRIENEITDENEKRAALEQNHRELMRAAFLTEPLATEEDFERLYPRIRDDRLCEHTSIVHRQTMERLMREFNVGKDPNDYLERSEDSEE